MFRSSRTPPPGYFGVIDNWKKQALSEGKDVIDLSVGASDLPPPIEAIEALRAATYEPSTYTYCLKNKTFPLLEAACAWYQRRYGVALNPHTEALSLIGAQEGLAHLLLGVTDHGDSILMLDVAYPSYWGALKIAGLTPLFLPQSPVDGLPDFERVPPADAARSKVLLLNYPNNPTTTTADDAFFEHAIAFAKQHNMLLVHDNPYVDQVYQGRGVLALSITRRIGCEHRAVLLCKEPSSCRVQTRLCSGKRKRHLCAESIKSPIDFNQYQGIQRMGIACLSLPDTKVRADAQTWHDRAATMVSSLAAQGWHVNMPKSGMYLWAKLPPGCGDDDSSFCQSLIAEEGVALSPGRGFGPGGHGHLRFALVAPVERLKEAATRVGRFIAAKQQPQQQH